MKYLKFLMAACGLAAMSGCSVSDSRGIDDLRPIITLGVVTVIEQSDDVTAGRVIDIVAEIRAITDLNGLITSRELLDAVDNVVDLSRLSPAHQVIIVEILEAIEDAMAAHTNIARVSVTADKLLTWVELAARMALP